MNMSNKVSDMSDRLTKLLETLGLLRDEASVYLFLLGKKEQSPLGISRQLGISRTKVYFILDKLQKKFLISDQGEKYAKRYSALPYTQLEQLVQQKKREVEMLDDVSQELYAELSALDVPQGSPSRVRYYQGIEGLKQVTWNSTQAVGILRVFEAVNDMAAFLDFDFSERVRIEFVKKGLKSSQQLTNYAKINPWTNIEEFVHRWECRFVNPKEFRIETEILIYNDVVALYQLRNDDIFCVEIENSTNAEMQKGLFDYVWKRAGQMQKRGERGEVRLRKPGK